jgi:prepilin-type N-terminal cleavage/methylation domain-containing protein/prepilin-type processing-associated H-X9-DG protein
MGGWGGVTALPEAVAMRHKQLRRGFTLIELLVALAIIAILAGLLLPVFAYARGQVRMASCGANLRQIGIGMLTYMQDYDERLPDRRDLKRSLPGGYRPWSGWPPSDPRSGWAGVVLGPYLKSELLWLCPAATRSWLEAAEVAQAVSAAPDAAKTCYWLWRFDRDTDPVPLDNLWGKTVRRALKDLKAANNPQIGQPTNPAEVELAVDPYFPSTIATTPPALKGRSVHRGGRNRLFLDGHTKFFVDARTQ